MIAKGASYAGCGLVDTGHKRDVFRTVAAVSALAVLGGGAISADRPRLVVTPASPTAGAEATISLLGEPASPVVIRLLSPRQSSSRLRLRVVGQKVWTVRYTFAFPGAWILTFKGATRRVPVAPYLESTFVPLGAAGCSPPSPANAFTHEARGSGTVWALLEVGSLPSRVLPSSTALSASTRRSSGECVAPAI